MTESEKAKCRERNRTYAKKNPEKRAKWNREWIANNRDKYNSLKWNYRDRVRMEVLTHYAGGVPQCLTCGVDDLDILVLDHINDDGAEHRRELAKNFTRRAGVNVYEDLRKKGYPPIVQVLCHNCNAKKEMVLRRSARYDNPFYTGVDTPYQIGE
jgi:hypothetical protein